MADARPIGVFDSGVGGLTVLHECLVTMPHEDFVYLGDHARLPYGPRSRDEVRRFAHEIGSYLERLGVKMVVVACNTATSVALPDLQEQLTVPVVSVIVPEAHSAVREYAEPLKQAGCDTVILGCTHYPLLRPVFQRAFGRDVTLVFSADETAREVAETLARKGFDNDAAREGTYRFLTTGEPELFRSLGERFLQLPLGDVERVEVAELEAVA